MANYHVLGATDLGAEARRILWGYMGRGYGVWAMGERGKLTNVNFNQTTVKPQNIPYIIEACLTMVIIDSYSY